VRLFPWLSLLVRLVLPIPAISTTPERLFSTAGNVMTKKRSRHTCDNMEELVYLHEVWRGAGLGGGHEDALGVIFFFNSMKHITFNTFSCLLFVDSETPSE